MPNIVGNNFCTLASASAMDSGFILYVDIRANILIPSLFHIMAPSHIRFSKNSPDNATPLSIASASNRYVNFTPNAALRYTVPLTMTYTASRRITRTRLLEKQACVVRFRQKPSLATNLSAF
jgi:hypothetical protein